jgi:Na+-translocating ferredoxin:NAD+ oxidoreductase subunit G
MATPSRTVPSRSTRSLSPQPLLSVLLLVVLALGAALLLDRIDAASRGQVARNEQAWILERLAALLTNLPYDNDLLADRIIVQAPDLLGTSRPVPIYRVLQAGAPRAVVIQTIAPDGYRGPLEILVGIAIDGRLIGVQVIRHQETPGLGDAFERKRGWLQAFTGRSLLQPPQQRWSVRQDGGEFDTFTGATITPRAIVKAVRRALEYYAANRRQIFLLQTAVAFHQAAHDPDV